MLTWLMQQMPEIPDSSFTRTDKLVMLGMLMAIITPTWMAWWNARIAKKATQPNSGHSMADKLTRIETQGDRIETKVDVHTMVLDTHRTEMSVVREEVTGVKGVIRELRRDLDAVRSDVHDLQEAQSHRRETIESEEGKDHQ